MPACVSKVTERVAVQIGANRGEMMPRDTGGQAGFLLAALRLAKMYRLPRGRVKILCPVSKCSAAKLCLYRYYWYESCLEFRDIGIEVRQQSTKHFPARLKWPRPFKGNYLAKVAL